MRSQSNRFSCHDNRNLLASCPEKGNPFDEVVMDKERAHSKDFRFEKLQPLNQQVTALIESYIGSSSLQSPLLPACFIDGIFPWLSRLLLIVKKLPSIVEDVGEVFSNVSDLYSSTAFRICCGSSKVEKIVLGVEPPAPTLDPENAATSRSVANSSPMFAFGRRSASQNHKHSVAPKATLPSWTDADICSPLPCETKEIEALRNLIFEAQDKLKCIAKLDLVDGWVKDANPADSRNIADLVCQSARVLEKRQAAAWGCAIMALTLQVAFNIAKSTSEKESNFQAMGEYVSRVVDSTPKLIQISNRITALRAIRGRIVVQQVSRLPLSSQSSRVVILLTACIMINRYCSLEPVGKSPNSTSIQIRTSIQFAIMRHCCGVRCTMQGKFQRGP